MGDYLEFDLLLDADKGQYKSRVVNSLYGEALGHFVLP